MPVSMLSTSLLSNKRSYSRFNALDTIYTPPSTSKPGMVLIKPTSIAHSGTSASIGENGQVAFTAVSSLSLNGVFSADFDNYVLVCQAVANTSSNFDIRFRASGSDNSTANSYVAARTDITNTTVEAIRTTSNLANITGIGSFGRSGHVTTFYAPFLAQPTVFRTVAVYNEGGNAYMIETGGTHNQSVSYDGFTVSNPHSPARLFTGTMTIYGLRS